MAPVSAEPAATVLYLHGGGWVHEAAPQHWQLVQQISAEAEVSVLLPVYPLLQAGDDAETVLPVVTRIASRSDRPLILMGDSAGGTIALSTSRLVAEQGHPADLTVLISPAIDLRMANPEIETVQPRDPWLVKTGQLLLGEMWTGGRFDDPIRNPILADASGAGPLAVFSGTRDILNPDTRRFVRSAREAGADVEYHEQAGHLHVYPLLPTPEARAARRVMIEQIRDVAAAR